jgi:ribosomal protein L35AE/L33A
MYIDFSVTNESTFEADICIIGAGAAGFSAGLTLLNSDLKILILEGGNDISSKEAADLHRGEITGHPHNGIHEARERVIGGTTTTWGGQALPFFKEDFEKRDHVNKSGWPINYKDLEPYYLKSEAILGTDTTVPYNYKPWKDWKIKEPDFTPSAIELFVTRWCKIPNFAEQHENKFLLSSNVCLLKNANVVELLPSDIGDNVKALRIRSLHGKSGIVQARFVIAAGGAMETVRLFLASKKFGFNGLGNKYGLVGRYFQDHIAAIVGEIFPSSSKKFYDAFDNFFKNGFKYFPRLRLTPSFAEREKILHASAQIIFSQNNNSAKTLMATLKKKSFPSLKACLSLLDPLTLTYLAKSMISWKIKNRGYSPRHGNIFLEIHSEQEPNFESCITLSNKTDALGMPRIQLNWSIPELSLKTIKTTALLVKGEFEKAGLGTVKLIPWAEGKSNELPRLTDTYHQAGGLKMAATPQEGVVDPRCCVFGVNNLYVASSAVFPTSSYSNPTMTTIALAIRVAETVEKLCKAKHTSEKMFLAAHKVISHEEGYNFY